jgi:hypothetical protein
LCLRLPEDPHDSNLLEMALFRNGIENWNIWGKITSFLFFFSLLFLLLLKKKRHTLSTFFFQTSKIIAIEKNLNSRLEWIPVFPSSRTASPVSLLMRSFCSSWAQVCRQWLASSWHCPASAHPPFSRGVNAWPWHRLSQRMETITNNTELTVAVGLLRVASSVDGLSLMRWGHSRAFTFPEGKLCSSSKPSHRRLSPFPLSHPQRGEGTAGPPSTWWPLRSWRRY